MVGRVDAESEARILDAMFVPARHDDGENANSNENWERRAYPNYLFRSFGHPRQITLGVLVWRTRNCIGDSGRRYSVQ